MLKKFAAIILALTLSVSAFASCSNGDGASSSEASASQSDSGSSSETDSSETSTNDSSVTDDEDIPEASLTIDGKTIDTKDLALCTVDGTDVDFDTFRYYYYSTLALYAQYGTTPADIEEDEDGFKKFMESVIEQIKQEFAIYKLAEENGIVLDDDDKKEIEKTFEEAKNAQESEEAFQQALKNSYMTEELFKHQIEVSTLYSKVDDELFAPGGKYATTADEFKKIVKDTSKYSRVIHVLIPYECQTEITDEDTKEGYDDLSLSQKLQAKQTAYAALSDADKAKAKEAAKKLAEEVLAKAENGDDFESLVKEYGWDPGMEQTPGGYYVSESTNFVKEFKTASFELKENEVSGLVESENYGWFIIKRLPVDMDYVEENIDAMINEYDSPTIDKIFNKAIDDLKIEYHEYYDKLTTKSIT